MIGFEYPYLPAVLALHVCETYAKYDASCLEFKISMNKQTIFEGLEQIYLFFRGPWIGYYQLFKMYWS